MSIPSSQRSSSGDSLPAKTGRTTDHNKLDLVGVAKVSSNLSHPDVNSTITYGRSGLRGMFNNKYVVLCALFASIGGLVFGYDQGVISVILTLPVFQARFTHLNPAFYPNAAFYKGLMTAMIELGAFFGALNQGWVADKYSRRYSIMIAVVWFVVGSILQTAAVNYAMLIVGRLIGGVAIGMLSMVAPLYMSEISPPEIRGTLLVLEEWSIVFGIVVAYWITYGTRFIGGGTSEWTYRLPFLLQIFPALFLGLGMFFVPFSPRWLASKGRDEECLESLARLRQLPITDPRLRIEWIQIRAEVAFHQEVQAARHPNLQDGSRTSNAKLEIASWLDCFKSGCWRRTMVGVGLMFFQQFVGINALIYYGPTLFQSLGLSYDLQLSMSGVMNVMQLVGVTGSIFFMDHVGRRPLLLWGSAATFVSQLIVAILVGKYSNNWPDNQDKAWAGVSFVFVYMVAFGLSWGPVPWAMPSEVFPSSLRAKGVALSTCSNWLNNFIIGLITPPLIENTGYGAYVFFAVFCLLSGVWTYFFVPETAHKSLEEMDLVFKDRVGHDDEKRRQAILDDFSGIPVTHVEHA
ncbi:putative MFS monosaccharide transporter [Taphrina deformans PYCC 5710]|uniref:MFS monosaccharide transporter n=1 Tax=Taphrina deformans (strain PYCC 5710 / ATCC 11124 / CBS 356.35 / IMI 108563 / JCM 9778 / NBRC 8474) TaxID=1097556 RepID=R4X6A6_TAPDE|nr:putative MFS monosaccharide transporter [Taphrina deformans PYCC 5710]|eukprot:CCG80554.1 putative MFS monosaccharide transporter [Taphrina deformans PYCC 5710]